MIASDPRISAATPSANLIDERLRVDSAVFQVATALERLNIITPEFFEIGKLASTPFIRIGQPNQEFEMCYQAQEARFNKELAKIKVPLKLRIKYQEVFGMKAFSFESYQKLLACPLEMQFDFLKSQTRQAYYQSLQAARDAGDKPMLAYARRLELAESAHSGLKGLVLEFNAGKPAAEQINILFYHSYKTTFVLSTCTVSELAGNVKTEDIPEIRLSTFKDFAKFLSSKS